MDGLTCLQLLANMPLVFRSQAPSMGTVKNLVYYCISLSPYSIFHFLTSHTLLTSSVSIIQYAWCLRLLFTDYNLSDTVLPEEGYEIDDDDDEDDGSVEYRQRTDLEIGLQDKAKPPSTGTCFFQLYMLSTWICQWKIQIVSSHVGKVHKFAAISRINYAIWRTLAKGTNYTSKI